MRKAAIFSMMVIIAITIAGCQESTVTNPEDSSKMNKVLSSVTLPSSLCGSTPYSLTAGQTSDVGELVVSNDEDYVYVTYNVDAPWLIKEVHLDYNNTGGFTERGAPGQYAYVSGILTPTNTFTFQILKSELDTDANGEVCFRAHASVVKLENGIEVQNETAFGGTITKPAKGAWYGSLCYTFFTCTPPPPQEVCYQFATAFGGNSSGAGNAWWYYFDGIGTQNIYAGQSQLAGTVSISNGVLTITLANGWELDNVTEPVKIQGYSALPSSRPSAGLFTTYKGISLTPTVGTYSYYVIHLDVRKEIPCNN